MFLLSSEFSSFKSNLNIRGLGQILPWATIIMDHPSDIQPKAFLKPVFIRFYKLKLHFWGVAFERFYITPARTDPSVGHLAFQGRGFSTLIFCWDYHFSQIERVRDLVEESIKL